MSRHGNYKGTLSEKDELIKSLREKQDKINNAKVSNAIKSKVDVLENNKTVEK